MGASRKTMIAVARSWLDKKESDGSYKEIIDTYNRYSHKPRNIAMKYSWPWCACFWSAVVIYCGYTDEIPIEISCGNLIEKAKKLGMWKENDAYVPKVADGILYDWNDDGEGDCTGWPDHIGIVEYVNKKNRTIQVIEGNKGHKVGRRIISLDGRYIRGFITPEYVDDIEKTIDMQAGKLPIEVANEVLLGVWGNGNTRRKNLTEKGYDYDSIQSLVTRLVNGAHKVMSEEKPNVRSSESKQAVTLTDLHLRAGAGTNKKSLCIMPKNSTISVEGYTMVEKKKWYYVTFVAKDINVIFTGFCSSNPKYVKNNP